MSNILMSFHSTFHSLVKILFRWLIASVSHFYIPVIILTQTYSLQNTLSHHFQNGQAENFLNIRALP